MIFEVTWDNVQKCREVYKNILWMYQDMVIQYGGFGHNIDFEPVDYMTYFFAYTEDDLQLGHLADTLAQGSVVAVCCEAVNLLDEESRSEKFLSEIKRLLSSPLLNSMPVEKGILNKIVNALEEEETFHWEAKPNGHVLNLGLREVYQKYVLGYYNTMISKGKQSVR